MNEVEQFSLAAKILWMVAAFLVGVNAGWALNEHVTRKWKPK
jgi:hypothetical protein